MCLWLPVLYLPCPILFLSLNILISSYLHALCDAFKIPVSLSLLPLSSLYPLTLPFSTFLSSPSLLPYFLPSLLPSFLSSLLPFFLCSIGESIGPHAFTVDLRDDKGAVKPGASSIPFPTLTLSGRDQISSTFDSHTWLRRQTSVS